MISTSVSSLGVAISENGDTLIECEVAILPENSPAGGECEIVGVELRLHSGQWVRTFPALSDDPFRPTEIDWSAVPFAGARGAQLDRLLIEFRNMWVSSGKCPDPGVYEVEHSEWARLQRAERFGCKHFLVLGHDIYVEVLALDLSWRWIRGRKSEAIETSDLDTA